MMVVSTAFDLIRYQELCCVHATSLKARPALVANDKKVLEKINILCLMEIIFSRAADDKTISLSIIAERTKLTIETAKEKASGAKEFAPKHFKSRMIVYPRLQNITSDEAMENVIHPKWTSNNVTKQEAHSNSHVLDDIILSDPKNQFYSKKITQKGLLNFLENTYRHNSVLNMGHQAASLEINNYARLGMIWGFEDSLFSSRCLKRKSKQLDGDRRRSNKRRIPNIVKPDIRTIEEFIPMADRTMEELLQVPTEGYGEAILILEILAGNFKIKTNLLQLVQSNKFHGRESENPHTHISNFKRMTATLKYRDVPNDAIKLMIFPYSLEDAARIWYEKEPPNSILTWDDLVNKLVNQFFPPSKTTHLKNEISHFTQRFEETFGEAWDRFKEMLRACPHYGFSELT
nr:reverse transcriptase domain-containing protein [Tanacetum cinerariifolium]